MTSFASWASFVGRKASLAAAFASALIAACTTTSTDQGSDGQDDATGAALSANALPSGPGFDNAEAAFIDAFVTSGIARLGYLSNREFAAAIYQLPDGRWHATAVRAGDQNTSAIPYHEVPSEAIHIVGAHTHGQPFVPDEPGVRYGVDFSVVDVRNAIHNFVASRGRIGAQLLISSELRVLRLTVENGPPANDAAHPGPEAPRPRAARDMADDHPGSTGHEPEAYSRTEILGTVELPTRYFALDAPETTHHMSRQIFVVDGNRLHL